MTARTKQRASKTWQESRRPAAGREHPAVRPPRGNGEPDRRVVEKSLRRLSGVLGH